MKNIIFAFPSARAIHPPEDARFHVPDGTFAEIGFTLDDLFYAIGHCATELESKTTYGLSGALLAG